MKAAVFRQPGLPWTVETIDDPWPRAGEMVLRVGRCGICGSDIHRTAEGTKGFEKGCVLGHEYAGEVVAIGEDVDRFRLGDRVAAMPFAGCGQCEVCATGNQMICPVRLTPYMGGFAEFVRIPARNAIRLPRDLSLADGAIVEPLSVGLHGVGLAGVTAKTRSLVLGAGAIGLAAIHALKHAGTAGIAAASRSDRRAGLAMELGADAFLVTGDELRQRAEDALGGKIDVVFECVGAVGALDECIDLVRPGGKVVTLGNCPVPDHISMRAATFKQVTLVFSAGYTLAEFQLAADRLAAGAVAPRAMVGSQIGLDALPSMIERIRRGDSPVRVHVAPTA